MFTKKPANENGKSHAGEFLDGLKSKTGDKLRGHIAGTLVLEASFNHRWAQINTDSHGSFTIFCVRGGRAASFQI
jgi:hypothetical protein